MTGYKRGDIVLISFVFTDENGVKKRPALVISSDTYHNQRDEAIIAAVTSRTDRVLSGDHIMRDWRAAGLLFPSTATGIIRTVKQSMIVHKLGSASSPDIKSINEKLRLAMAL